MNIEIMFAIALVVVPIFAYISHKKKWKITEFF